MKRLLVVYSSKHGQAAAIARRVSEKAACESVRLVDVRSASPADLAACDSVVIVASVYFGRHSRAVRKFIEANRQRLSEMHSAFVSVSGSASESETKPLALSTLESFLKDVKWSPERREIFGGALKFTKYNVFVRFVVRRALAAQGKTIDTGRDYDYTDWPAVERFALSL